MEMNFKPFELKKQVLPGCMAGLWKILWRTPLDLHQVVRGERYQETLIFSVVIQTGGERKVKEVGQSR
jgi:hypothetical protein